MSGRKLTVEQAAKLNQLRQFHVTYVTAKAELRQRIEAEFESQLRDKEIRESILMNEARNLGIPKTEIGRAVGLANWLTLESKYAMTANDFVVAEENQLSSYTYDNDTHILTVNWVEINGIRYDGHLGMTLGPSNGVNPARLTWDEDPDEPLTKQMYVEQNDGYRYDTITEIQRIADEEWVKHNG